MRLQFERGDLTLYGWVPVRIQLNGLLDWNATAKLKALMPDAVVEIFEPSEVQLTKQAGAADDGIAKPPTRSVTGRFKHIEFDHRVSLAHGDDSQKMSVYADLLKKMIIDQRAWIFDNSVERVTDANNAVESLRLAEAATKTVNKF
jgi:hypothetical protein